MFRTPSKVRSVLPLIVTLVALTLISDTTQAQEVDGGLPAAFEAEVIGVAYDGSRMDPTGSGEEHQYQVLQVRIEEGPRTGETIEIENGQGSSPIYERYRSGDRVLVTTAGAPGATVEYYITDRVRREPLGILFVAFVLLTVLVGRTRGALSLVAMAITMLAIFGFILPQIVAGRDPILVVVGASVVIIPVTYYLSHGLNQKTNAAIVGTIIALVVSGLLAKYAVNAAHLTGAASEDAVFLQTFGLPTLNLGGLLLASMVVGLLGVLDDVTISQAAVVAQLRAASPDARQREVFTRAMDVGRDHIASIVNTLVLVYASSALPLLLLFHSSSATFNEVVNFEVVAAEIVRTLVASIGLILAVPITTVIAARFITSPARRVIT